MSSSPLPTFLLVLSGAVASFASKDRISILNFEIHGVARSIVTPEEIQDLSQQVRDQAAALVDTSKFEIMTLESILVMLPPGKSLSECEDQCEVVTARNIGSRWHVVGDVKKVGRRLVLSMRLYDVSSGTLLGGDRVVGAGIDEIVDSASAHSARLLRRIPGVGTPHPPSAALLPRIRVEFRSVPAGAQVSVDGEVAGTTPFVGSIAAGTRRVSMSREGCSARGAQLELRGDTALDWGLEASLVRVEFASRNARTGEGVPADLFVDGARMGRTPVELRLPSGRRRIVAESYGFERNESELVLEDGVEVRDTIRLVPASRVSILPAPAQVPSVPGAASAVEVFRDARDGKEYPLVRIGSRSWMARNLDYATRGSWCYAGDPSNCAVYGRLYDGDAATSACPAGWHLPSDGEWNELVEALGGESSSGAKLKATVRWQVSENDFDWGRDEQGFCALPSGVRKPRGEYSSIGRYAFFWTSTREDGGGVYRYLVFSSPSLHRVVDDESFAFSVRCVRD